MLAQVIKVRSTHFNDKSNNELLNNTSLLIHYTVHLCRDNRYLYLHFSLIVYHMHRMYRYLLFLNFLQGLLLNHVRPGCRFCDYLLHLLYQHLLIQYLFCNYYLLLFIIKRYKYFFEVFVPFYNV